MMDIDCFSRYESGKDTVTFNARQRGSAGSIHAKMRIGKHVAILAREDVDSELKMLYSFMRVPFTLFFMNQHQRESIVFILFRFSDRTGCLTRFLVICYTSCPDLPSDGGVEHVWNRLVLMIDLVMRHHMKAYRNYTDTFRCDVSRSYKFVDNRLSYRKFPLHPSRMLSRGLVCAPAGGLFKPGPVRRR